MLRWKSPLTCGKFRPMLVCVFRASSHGSISFAKYMNTLFNPFHNTPFWDHPNSKKLQTTTVMWLLKGFKIHNAWKTLWEKVKLLILSNFTFFHNVFRKFFFFFFLQCVKISMYGGKDYRA